MWRAAPAAGISLPPPDRAYIKNMYFLPSYNIYKALVSACVLLHPLYCFVCVVARRAAAPGKSRLGI